MVNFSKRLSQLKASPIREILSVIEKPGMISFAGGLPAVETFPEFNIRNIPKKYLQYGPSEGETELRAELQKHLKNIGLPCQKEQILMLSGSQQGIDLVAKLFIDVGTLVAVESPTYLAALQVFNYFGAKLAGFVSSSPEALFNAAIKPSLAYVIPTFQNPTGYCYSTQERQNLANLCDNCNVTLFEDDPYRELVYDACDRTPICSLLKKSSWIYQGSFSKTLSPGLRLGYLVCSPDLIQTLTWLKQAADLHSNRLSPYLVLNEIQQPDYYEKLTKLAKTYQMKKVYFASMLEKYLSKYASWEIPKGGLFFWLKLKQMRDTELLLKVAIKHNIAFMPGTHFFSQAPVILPIQESYIRLNFSHANQEQVELGLKKLGELLKN